MKGRYKTYLKVLLNLGIMLVLLLFCMFVLPRVVIYFMPFVLGWVIAWIASLCDYYCNCAGDTGGILFRGKTYGADGEFYWRTAKYVGKRPGGFGADRAKAGGIQ